MPLSAFTGPAHIQRRNSSGKGNKSAFSFVGVSLFAHSTPRRQYPFVVTGSYFSAAREKIRLTCGPRTSSTLFPFKLSCLKQLTFGNPVVGAVHPLWTNFPKGEQQR